MRTYCFKTCISISHSNDNNRIHSHIHTVEVAAYVKYKETYTDIKKFEDAEVLIDTCLEPYRECYLNDMVGFEDNVSLEYLGERLFQQLDDKLDTNGMLMEKFEISETPLRAYIITRTI
jgi:6-pyruvoyl tetrahydropterin synthase-like protein